MIHKLLIANRGEICCRVIKTAKRMGIATVAVYSDADQNALHVKLADEAVYLGPAPSKLSYLCGDKIIAIARKVGANAIHPGYGFLSENAEFARQCAHNNITFIGPPISAIEAMGSKSAAKHIMQQANVPLVPGYHGDEQAADILKYHADTMGYPVLLKAAAGGGGKGMRQVWHASEFNDALAAAKREALSSFNDDHMLVEKYLTQPRHVEIQVFCDQHENGVYLFERDCSIQRRHQKVIEEAPAPGLSETLRQQMGEAALKAAKAINYVGAGTVEFLLDVDQRFYFMEMNTRLQVEHPVTELITGQDLVEWQIRVANHERLPLTQEQLKIKGHAFEARIYAEDPNNNFLPATGRLSLIKTPNESAYVRIDTGIQEGDEVSVYYDPMLAKLIVWDQDRSTALARLQKALSEYFIDGVSTNIDFLSRISQIDDFKAGAIDTSFIEKHQEQLSSEYKLAYADIVPIAALALLLERQQQTNIAKQDPYSPWSVQSVWRANDNYQEALKLYVNDESHDVLVNSLMSQDRQLFNLEYQQQNYTCWGILDGQQLISSINGHISTSTISVNSPEKVLFTAQGRVRFSRALIDLGLNEDTHHTNNFTAPMNGTVVAILVDTNERVEPGQTLLVMEAMKMEHAIKAKTAGRVSEFYFNVGELVDGGAELLAFHGEEGA
ncbi:MAG: acetyl/propionyl/methylcrotonyl-CoA carboxylase subunit alpha [Paraglaciecola sp.]|nr:acetyl/propionyl/methylcrotonyl-CoA carboxylase subunit alpha [Paraglaciecola sp.]